MLNHFEEKSFESQNFHNQIKNFFTKCSKGVSILLQALHIASTLGWY